MSQQVKIADAQYRIAGAVNKQVADTEYSLSNVLTHAMQLSYIPRDSWDDATENSLWNNDSVALVPLSNGLEDHTNVTGARKVAHDAHHAIVEQEYDQAGYVLMVSDC